MVPVPQAHQGRGGGVLRMSLAWLADREQDLTEAVERFSLSGRSPISRNSARAWGCP